MKRFLLALPLLFATPAMAEAKCLADHHVQILIEGMGMELFATGVSTDTPQPFAVKWYVSESGDWIVVYSNELPPLTCIVASGRDFEFPVMPEKDIGTDV